VHELSITGQLLDITLEHAEKAMASRVLKINLVIGDLTGFSEESIKFYFDILSEGTKANKALLYVTRVPVLVRCGQCRTEFTPGDRTWRCPLCEGAFDEIVKGREFYVESIEVE